MRYIYIIFIASHVLFFNNIYGQNTGAGTGTNWAYCEEEANRYSRSFIEHWNSYTVEEFENLFVSWERSCGVTEPLERARVLHAIDRGTFTDSDLKEGVLQMLFVFKNRQDQIRGAAYFAYPKWKDYYGYIPFNEDFDLFTKAEAERLKGLQEPNSLAYLLCDLYSGHLDSVHAKLKNISRSGSVYAKEYEKKANEIKRAFAHDVAMLAGVWQPTGALKVIGPKLDFGLRVGFKVNRFSMAGVGTLRYINSVDSFDFSNPREMVVTHHRTNKSRGTYLGIDLGYDVFRKKNHEAALNIGLGFDRLFPGGSSLNTFEKKLVANSYDISFGPSYLYYFKNENYIGFRLKAHIVDHSLNNVIFYSGTPLSLHLTFGVLNNSYKTTADRLGYKIR